MTFFVMQAGFFIRAQMTEHRQILPFVLMVFIVLISTVCSGSSFKEGRRLYLHYCTPCHGKKGNGKGFNARYLDPRPANHTDSEFMSKRTDGDLFDAIYGGGRAVGKSPLMPPWGETLSEDEIKSLIIYLRWLCRCQHPVSGTPGAEPPGQ